MSWFEIAHVGEGDQLPEMDWRRSGLRSCQERNVIAEGKTLQDPSTEPGSGVVEYRQAVGAVPPCTAGELVDVVAGLTAEQPGEIEMLAAEDVNG
jgi:hypothetical protein